MEDQMAWAVIRMTQAEYTMAVKSFPGEAKTGVPRVIVSGFNTDPAEIAGSNFNLIVHLKNTSQGYGGF